MPVPSHHSRRAAPFAAVVVASLAITATAQAGVAEVSGATMSFDAGAGEVNNVRAEPRLDGVLFTDASAPLVAGAGCAARIDGVFCAYPPAPGGVAIELRLLDGNDRGFVDDLTGTGIVAAMSVFGGHGDDFAHVGGSDPRVALADGGPGDDELESFMNRTGSVTLTGDAGDDELRGNEIGFKTLLTGGDGADRIVIGPAVGPGPVFEGGGGNDTIVDNSGGSAGEIAAGRGFDTLTFADVVFGEPSIDLALCPACDVEKVVGSDLDDTLRGDAGSTLFIGGAGKDLIEPRGGTDAVSAGSGADSVLVGGDRRIDFVRCGADQDEVDADRRDIVARDCEVVTR